MGSVNYKRARVESVSTQQPVLDVVYLQRCTFGDEALRTEILNLFFAQVNGMARSLAQPMDDTAWHFLTHTLKGASAAVGAVVLAQMAENWGGEKPPATALARDSKARALEGALSDLRAVCSTLAA